MRIKNKKLSLSIVSLLACFSGQAAFGNGYVAAPTQVKEFNLPPRLYMWGFSGDKTLAEGQGMLPLFGDQNYALYGLGEVNGVQGGSWLVGGGAGYRRVVNNRIFGGYLLADYNTSPHNNSFWILNPALEMLGTVWDANINGYFPLNRRKSLGKEDWADNLGVYKYVHYTEHKEYDHRLKLFEEAGMGGDFEIGRVIPRFHQARLYVGGYYFDTEDAGSITGARGRLIYRVNKWIAVELEDTYDDENHNKFLAGIRFTLGGYTDQENQQYGISSRLLDPIEHNFAILAGSEGLIVPVKKKFVDEGIPPGPGPGPEPEKDSLWWYIPLGPSVQAVPGEDGSFEKPFVGFTNYEGGTLKQVDPNLILGTLPILMVGTGEYPLNESTGFLDGRWTMPNGWGVEGVKYDEAGKEFDLTGPPIGDDRPVFLGGFDVKGSVNSLGIPSTLDSVIIRNNGISPLAPQDNFKQSALGTIPPTSTLSAVNAGIVVLKNVGIEREVAEDDGDALGIYVENSTVNFEAKQWPELAAGGAVGENTVTAKITNGGTAIGILATDSTINFTGGTNTISSEASDGNDNYSYGIDSGGTTINFTGGTNTISSEASGEKNNWVYGIHSIGVTINFTGGTNTISSEASGGEIENLGYGIYSENNSTINFTEGMNTISSKASGGNKSGSSGIYSENNSTINFTAGTNTISSEALDGINNYSHGIYSEFNSTINFTAGTNTISSEASGGGGENLGYGIYSTDNSFINFKNSENNHVIITANASASSGGTFKRYGIYADNSTSIKDKEENPMTEVNIGNYATFKSSIINIAYGNAAVWVGKWAGGTWNLSPPI